jgi:hypothetical protein
MTDIYDGPDALQLFHSGAGSHEAAQSDPDAALGNYISNSRATEAAWSVSSPISNVTVDFVKGSNAVGNGSLDAPSSDTLTWQAPGSATAGPAVTIANGETKVLEDGDDASQYIIVTRTSATALSGTATVTVSEVFNNVIGFDNLGSAERAAGDDEYRAFALRNMTDNLGAPYAVDNIYVWIDPEALGTAATSDSAQLGASGSGTLEDSAGSAFADWPEQGWCAVVDNGGALREVVYYASRTDDVLTIAAGGRERLGSTADAGASDDTLYAVPGLRIALESPDADPTGKIQVIADEDTAPTGLSWDTPYAQADGLNIASLAAGYWKGVWIHREYLGGEAADANVLNCLKYSYDAA